MTSQLSKWSFLVLLPALALNCDATESDLADAQESDTGSFDQFRAHPEASLLGSNFEIDVDANLKVDDAAPSQDWANVAHTKITEEISKDDNSYAGGVKEDSICPPVGTGSIPVNKSDITAFGMWQERIQGGPYDPGFLHLFWARVQEPSGTTLMDFELNQSSVKCPGANPHNVRTIDDLLIEYRIEQGGAKATIRIRKWTANGWGTAVALGADQATGTINNSLIPIAESNGLDQELDPRTFGEASIDLDVIFDKDECQSFGSAFVKSRASDSFSSALKDFTLPIPVNITNCGGVTIRKDIEPDNSSVEFDFTMTRDDEVADDVTFKLGDNDSEALDDVVFGDYTVTEDQSNPLYDLYQIDCSNSVGVTPVVDADAGTVTFTIDANTDRVDCKYYNRRRGGAIKIIKERGHAEFGDGPHPHGGVDFLINGGGLVNDRHTTDADGEICIDGLPLDGVYTVTESPVPTGYWDGGVLTKPVPPLQQSTCDDGNASVVNFHNTPLTDLTCSVDSQVVGGTRSTITCEGVNEDVLATTPQFGDGFLTLPDLLPGEYDCTIVISDGMP